MKKVRPFLWVLPALLLVGAMFVSLPEKSAPLPSEDTPKPMITAKEDLPENTVAAQPISLPEVTVEEIEINKGDDTPPAEQQDALQGNVEIAQKLTWEAIQSFPIKSADMSIQELRDLCAEFFAFSKNALWTPKETIRYIRNNGGTEDVMRKGTIYGGLPYVGVASGNVYRLMELIDEQTGEVDIRRGLVGETDTDKVFTMDQLKYFGSQCSIGAYWGWGRVINSADYRWSYELIHNRGFFRVGPYTYDDSKTKFDDDYTTIQVCAENGEQTMYESYALVHTADGLVHYTTGGHAAMVASDAYVERLENGQIDGDNSFILVTDQAQSWVRGVSAGGDRYQAKNRTKEKLTFKELFEGYYLPFTYAEWQGTDPIEETVCTFSHIGSTITKGQLFTAKINANYGIADAYAIVTDDSAREIYRHAVRCVQGGQRTMDFVATGNHVDTWGKLPQGRYNLEIVVQLATGERPTVYTGTLIV